MYFKQLSCKMESMWTFFQLRKQPHLGENSILDSYQRSQFRVTT